jgi:hypothetical protein
LSKNIYEKQIKPDLLEMINWIITKKD